MFTVANAFATGNFFIYAKLSADVILDFRCYYHNYFSIVLLTIVAW